MENYRVADNNKSITAKGQRKKEESALRHSIQTLKMGKAGAGSAAENKEADQKQKNKKIGSIYHDIGSAGGFAGARTLYNEVKARYPDVTKRDVQHFLEGDRTYTLFKPRRLNFPKSKTIPMGFMTNLQVYSIV